MNIVQNSKKSAFKTGKIVYFFLIILLAFVSCENPWMKDILNDWYCDDCGKKNKNCSCYEAVIYLQGATGNMNNGFVMGGPSFKEIIVVFDKMIVGLETEITFTWVSGGGYHGIDVTPAFKSNVPFLEENAWGSAGAALPQYGRPSPLKWTPEGSFDILKLSATHGMDFDAEEATVKITSIKVSGKKVTLSFYGDYFDSFEP